VLDLGLLIAANGAGAVIGALIFSAIGHTCASYDLCFRIRFNQLEIFPLCNVSPISIALIFVVIASMGAGPLNPIIGAVEYERVPRTCAERVGGAIGAGAWSAMPLGMLIGGVLTEQLGVRSMLIGWASSISLPP